jgi:hypothetical protein
MTRRVLDLTKPEPDTGDWSHWFHHHQSAPTLLRLLRMGNKNNMNTVRYRWGAFSPVVESCGVTTRALKNTINQNVSYFFALNDSHVLSNTHILSKIAHHVPDFTKHGNIRDTPALYRRPSLSFPSQLFRVYLCLASI